MENRMLSTEKFPTMFGDVRLEYTAMHGNGGRGREAGALGNSVHYSSANREWETPQPVFDALDEYFNFTIDVCATPENAKCGRYYTREQDGLVQDWAGETCWMNPPYGREIGKWMKKAHESGCLFGATVVCLVPARTDTRWWHDYAVKGEVLFLKGRLKFGGAKSSAPFPSAVVVFRKPELEWREAFLNSLEASRRGRDG